MHFKQRDAIVLAYVPLVEGGEFESETARFICLVVFWLRAESFGDLSAWLCLLREKIAVGSSVV